MNPPIVYDDTIPSSHNTNKTTNSVQSIVNLPLNVGAREGPK